MRIEGSNSIPTATKNKGILERLKIPCCAVTQIGFVYDHSRKERAQGKGNSKKFGRTKRHAEARSRLGLSGN